MAPLRGERFYVNLSDDDDVHSENHNDSESFEASPRSNLIGDIKEHSPAPAASPPIAPQLKSSSTGFPAHRNRLKQSAFKQQKAKQGALQQSESSQGAQPSLKSQSTVEASLRSFTDTDAQSNHDSNFERMQKLDIDKENKQRLAEMSTEEIEHEKADLLAGLPPSLIERFLRRATIDDETQIVTKQADTETSPKGSPPGQTQTQQPKSWPNPSTTPPAQSPSRVTLPFNSDAPPSAPPADLYPASQPANSQVHFPVPPTTSPAPILDPSSPTFLADLQTHYFPNLTHDFSSLSWLQPPTASETSASPYNPSKDSIPAGQLRFSFTGALIPPTTSLSIPVSKGLHHHATAPESAGYTIPEISILSRSTVPAQRCAAWQILGRLLYRLGSGGFGEPGDELVEGLWGVIERERVVGGMLEEAGKGKHASAKAWAVEGVWLWRKGGGGDRGLLKNGEMRAK